VDGFNASQDRIYVRYLMTNSIHQKAMVSILGGAPPDILGLYAFNVPSYAEANAVLPLEDLARAQGLSLEHWAAGMRPIMTFRTPGSGATPKWYGIINTAGTLGLFWNRALFREHASQLQARGLDAERAPRTIQELDAANEVLSKTSDGSALGKGPLARAGFIHMEPGWWSWIWPAMFGGALAGGMYDEATDAATCASPASIAAYEWMQSYPKRFGVEHVEKFRAGFGPYGTPQSAFLTGEAAMVVQGPWMANLIKAFKPELDYGVASLPIDESLLDEGSPLTCIDTDVLMIPRGAKHPEASMEFIAYTQRRENVEALATAHCKGSPLSSVSEEFLASHPNRGVRLHTSMATSPRAFIAPTTPNWPQYKDLVDTAFQDLWKLQGEPRVRLAGVEKTANEILAKAREHRRMRGEG
jgi:multiple sugar transport system substrate-binding protein